MENFKRTVKFIDSDDTIVGVTVELTYRNKYPELSFCGSYGSSYGQIDYEVDPIDGDQRKLVGLWEKYHLGNLRYKVYDEGSLKALEAQCKSFPTDTELSSKLLDENYKADCKINELLTTINEVMDGLDETWEETLNSDSGIKLAQLPYEEVLPFLEEACINDTEIAYFLGCLEDLSVSDIYLIEEPTNGFQWQVGKVGYLAGDDEGMDALEEEYVESTIEECYLHEVPQHVLCYIDMDRWIKDWCGNRGENLGSYDGNELSMEVNGTTYYAYKN